MPWLVDTNIVSETRRLKPEPKVLSFVADLPLGDLYISTVSLAELRFGIEILTKGDPRRHELNAWLTCEVRPMFEGRVLPITEDIMLRWRIMVEEGRKMGHTFSQPDLIIAATASCHRLTVVTRNRRDYEKAGVPVISPWDA
jgi:toxin FitB